ncbi:MAG TPA: trehalase-like domain-containing protein, partial [Planctomycetota bacterium]|nr:trehalase-like domain-containing protein [Planctomycetota bacterium]
MPSRIEDYALLGDCHTAALVGLDGSIDWMCVPRFDSGACFAALLGTPENGRWRIAPVEIVRAVRRRYRPGTLILETEFETDSGVVRLVDCMPFDDPLPDVVRTVQGLRGRVRMRMELVIRFDYGSVVPWVRSVEGVLHATAGPHTLELHTPVATHGENLKTVAEFVLGEDERVGFTLRYHPSHEPPQPKLDAEKAVLETERAWRAWTAR